MEKRRGTQYTAKLGELRGKVFQVQTDTRKEYLSQSKILESKRDKIREIYGHFREASVSVWKDAKKGLKKFLRGF